MGKQGDKGSLGTSASPPALSSPSAIVPAAPSRPSGLQSAGAVLLTLAERCEQASGPERELDGDIHEALFGAKRGRELGFSPAVADVRYYMDPGSGNGLLSPIAFTGCVEAAERALPGPEWPEYQITRRYCTGYHASVGLGADTAGCDTPALALAAACLKARAALAKARG